MQGSKEKIPSSFILVAPIIILCDGSLLVESTANSPEGETTLVKREHISTSVNGGLFKTM